MSEDEFINAEKCTKKELIDELKRVKAYFKQEHGINNAELQYVFSSLNQNQQIMMNNHHIIAVVLKQLGAELLEMKSLLYEIKDNTQLNKKQ